MPEPRFPRQFPRQFPRRIALRALALAAVLATSGCALFHRNLEPPKVTLKGLTPEALTSDGQVFRTRLLLENPNDEDLKVVGGQVTLTLADVSAGRGEVIEGFVLPAYGSQEVDLRVRLDLLSVLPELVRLLTLGPGELGYELRGYVDLDVKALGRLPFRSKGTVQADALLRQVPGLLRRAPAAPAGEAL